MKEKIKNAAFKAYKFSNSWTGTVIIVLLVIFFVAQAFKIPSGSMKDSLLIGDHLFAKKFAYGISTPHLPFLEFPLVPGTDGHIIDGDTPERGDIVIFRYPKNHKVHFVKRCVALPGDILFVNEKDLYIHMNEGDDYIKANYPSEQIIPALDMLFVKNPYQKDHPGIHHDKDIVNNGTRRSKIFFTSPIKVPENEYFMMGDNRDHSSDSRFWGTVPYGLIEGTPWFVYFSIELRSYKEIFSDDMLQQGNDPRDLFLQCQKVINKVPCDNNIYSSECIQELKKPECEKIWNSHQYTIRWDRMGKTPTDLEGVDYLNRIRAEDKKNDEGTF